MMGNSHYKAKAFGVGVGTRVRDARYMCPGIVFRGSRHKLYVRANQKIASVVDEIAELERIHETLFGTLGDARKTLEEWQEDYNWRRPHSALGNLTPMEFLQRRTMDKMAA
jgi:putative transposase